MSDVEEPLPGWQWAGEVLDAVEGLAEAHRAASDELRVVRGLDPAVDAVLDAARRVVGLAGP